jgi:hypothetical protein
MSERRIEMTPAVVARMVEIAEVGVVFRDPERQRLLAAKVLARAVTDDEVWELVQAAAIEDFPTDEPPFPSTNGAA